MEKLEQPFALLQRWAAERPDSEAIRSADSVVTWAELHDTARRFATLLRESGVQPGQVVAVSLPTAFEVIFAQALFHEAAIGCTFSSGYDGTGDLVFDWLIALNERPTVPASRTILIDAAWLHRASTVVPVAEARPFPAADSVLRLVFSSGTTGQPKAVPLTLEALAYRSESAKLTWWSAQPYMCLLGFATVSGVQAYFSCLGTGSTFLVQGSAAENFALLAKNRVQSIMGSPVQLSELLQVARQSEFAAVPGSHEAAWFELPDLSLIHSVGSLLPDFLADQLHRQFSVDVVNIYGSSETGVVAVRRAAGNEGEAGNDSFTAGTILADAVVHIVDDQHEPVAPGTVGMIRIRRAHQPEGYYRDAAASALAFRDGWFYPGDLGSIRTQADDQAGAPGEQLILAGRSSEIINAAGVKVDPGRVEAAALLFAGVRDAAAFGAMNALGIDVISLAVVADSAVDAPALARFLRQRLGDAAPSTIVRVAEIPRNTMGKIRRRELPDLAASHAVPPFR